MRLNPATRREISGIHARHIWRKYLSETYPHLPLRGCAELLHHEEVKPVWGRDWSAMAVRRVIDRVGEH